MKKIHFVIMAVALVFGGCVPEYMKDPSGTSEKMVKIRLSTMNPPEIVDTRTMLDENFDVKWHHADEVFMVSDNVQNGGIKTGRLTNVLEDGYEGLFEGEVPENWLSNNSRETVLYSYKVSEWSAACGETLNETDWGKSIRGITLPSEQPLVSGTFARHYNLSAATFELNDKSTPLYFHNICGLIKLNLKGNADIKKVEISAPGKMNGIFTLKSNFQTGENTVYTIEMQEKGSADVVTLLSEDGLELTAEPQSFYASVLPENIRVGSAGNAGPGAGEYTVAVTTVEGKVVTKTVSVEKGIVAGRYTDLGEMEVNYTFADADNTVCNLNPAGETVAYNVFLSSDEPVVEGITGDWLTSSYDSESGNITFTCGAYLGEGERSETVTIIQGDHATAITFSQKPVPAVKISSLYSDADAHTGYIIEKTEYLPSDYTVSVDASVDWFTAVKDGSGNIVVSVDANDSGAVRKGAVTIRTGDMTVVGTIPVIQTLLTYESLLAEYKVTYYDVENGRFNSGTNPVDITERTAGQDYHIVFRLNYVDVPVVLDYVSIGPGCGSFICPQEYEKCTIGSKSYNYLDGRIAVVRAARKPGGSDFKLSISTSSEIDVTEDGCGFDLVPVFDGGSVVGYDFVPDFKTRSLYPEGVEGIWFPEYKILTKDGDGKALTWESNISRLRRYLGPLDGQEYLRMTRSR